MTYTLLRLSDVRRCRILGRDNRFTVAVVVEGEGESKAYINNTGRLFEYMVPGRLAYCTAKREGRLPYRLFAVSEEGLAALIDTWLQMRGFEKAVSDDMLPWMRGCSIARRNPRVGGSILDYLALCRGERVWIEVKSAAMRGPGGYAMYPDCPSLRGRRHILELMNLSLNGERTLLVFIAAIPGAKGFKPYEKGDPKIARLLSEAASIGVGVRALSLHYDPASSSIVLENPDLPVALGNTNIPLGS